MSVVSRGLLALLVGTLWIGGAQGQDYPSRPVHILTGPAGGGSDLTARVVANELRTSLGRPVLVENRASITLPAAIMQAAPDGHTLLMFGPALWIGPLLEKAPYDPIREFAPITALTRSPYFLIVTPTLPVKTVSDLVKLAKAKPGQLNYSSSTTGSATHIAGELFKSLADVEIQRIVYKNQSNENTDLFSGEIHLTFGTAAGFGELIKTGKLRALASTGSRPSLFFPDLPTIAQTLPGYRAESMFAFFGPGKTPETIVRRLNTETLRVLGKSEVRERLLANGIEVAGGTPEQLIEAMKADMAVMSKMIKDGVIKPGEL